MKKSHLIVCLLLALSLKAFAQPSRPYTRDEDKMWAKTIWRVVDMREKLNQIYFYPLEQTEDRISLIDLLRLGIREGQFTPYEPHLNGADWKKAMDPERAMLVGTSEEYVRMNRPDPPYEEYDTVFVAALDNFNVRRFKVKEEWFFDKKRSVMDVRILGICPVLDVYDQEGELKGFQDMFWIKYDEARAFFHQYKVYNPNNSAQRLTYDDSFKMHMFKSYIYKEDNVFDRSIQDYIQGVDAIRESEEIEKQIREYEFDLWQQ